MSDQTNETGTIQTVLNRFNSQHLPRALALKREVDGGARLTDLDVQFLKEVLQDAKDAERFAERHEAFQPLIVRAIELYGDITRKAMENEQASEVRR
jgi:hypothetical protein